MAYTCVLETEERNRNWDISVVFKWDGASFENPSCVCDDYVDNIFLFALCVVVSERGKKSLLFSGERWNGNEKHKNCMTTMKRIIYLPTVADGSFTMPCDVCLCVRLQPFRWLVLCLMKSGIVCFSPLTPSVRKPKPEVWCCCYLCALDKLWPAFNRRLLNRTERRRCQTEGTAATTVLEY